MASGWPPERFIRKQLDEIMSEAASGDSLVISLSETAYRFCSVKYADRDHFTDGKGATKLGGRFTPRGGQPTVYLSRQIVTASSEVESWLTYYKLPPDSFQPRVLAAVAVSVSLVLDLCRVDTLDRLGITAEHLAQEWRPANDDDRVAPVQSFGAMVCAAGYEGVQVPSMRHRAGINLPLFPGNFRDGSHAVALHLE